MSKAGYVVPNWTEYFQYCFGCCVSRGLRWVLRKQSASTATSGAELECVSTAALRAAASVCAAAL